MTEIFDIYTLIFLEQAVVIAIRLHNVLGSKTGNERRWDHIPGKDKADKDEKEAAEATDNVIPLPGAAQNPVAEATMTRSKEDIEAVLDKHAKPGTPLREKLKALIEKDKNFDPDHFLKGARVAYELIVTSFAEGNRNMLRDLLSPEVYEGFSQAIKEREERGETVDSSFVGIEKSEIIDAQIRGEREQVTVKFISSLITATMNAEGKVIDGDPKKVLRVTDIWTFARQLTSPDPNWQLIATEGAK